MQDPSWHPTMKTIALAAVVLASVLATSGASAHDPHDRVRIMSKYGFAETIAKLESAVSKNGLGLVTQANAQNGARSLGVVIPGNQVWGLFAPRFAVRMLKADADAGIEAPVRLYIAEAANGTVTVTYVKPSDVFAPYRNAELDILASELDRLFAAVVEAVK
jgi:uncharacterized protein (DUF302 family)